jgi:hypothetical protein
MLRDWSLINKPDRRTPCRGALEEWASELEKRSLLRPRITWDPALHRPHQEQSLPNRCELDVGYDGNVVRQVVSHEVLPTVNCDATEPGTML